MEGVYLLAIQKEFPPRLELTVTPITNLFS